MEMARALKIAVEPFFVGAAILWAGLYSQSRPAQHRKVVIGGSTPKRSIIAVLLVKTLTTEVRFKSEPHLQLLVPTIRSTIYYIVYC